MRFDVTNQEGCFLGKGAGVSGSEGTDSLKGIGCGMQLSMTFA